MAERMAAGMTTIDWAGLRRRFPALSRREGGLPVVLLDGPGGTQVPESVIEAVAHVYREMNANDGGAFGASQAISALARTSHAAIADLYGATDPAGVKVGANMTSLTFALSRSLVATFSPGDEIVVTELDHEANVSPWRLAAADRGLVVRAIPVRLDDLTLDLDALDGLLGPRTRLVAVGYASNAVGTVNPVAEIIRRARAAGALTWVDAVHYAPHGPVDVRALGCDFLVSSAYKWFGPHLGALWGRPEILAELPAYKVRPAHDRFETGTPAFELLAGTAAAVDYLAAISAGRTPEPDARRAAVVASMEAIVAREAAVGGRLLAGLRAIRGVRVHGITDPDRMAERTPTFGITIAGHHPRAVTTALAAEGIAAWDGDFYATGLVERIGLAESGGLIRLGLVHYNTEEEVDRTLGVLERIAAAPAGSLRAI